MDVVSASGQALIDLAAAMMTLERRPLENVQARRQLVTQEISARRSLGSQLSGLRRLADDFAQVGSLSPLRRFRVSAGETNAFTATAGSSATDGVHNVEVLSLARRQSLASVTLTGNEQTLAAALGSDSNQFRFEVTVGDETEEITVQIDPEADDGAVLQAVADAIDRSELGISGSVVRVADGEVRLLVQAETSGTAARITRLNDLEGSLLSALGLSGGPGEGGELPGTVQEGADALVRIDGIEVRAATNRIDNVLDGISLDLNAVTEGEVNLLVERDEDAVIAEVQRLVDAYNASIDEVRGLTRPSDEEGAGRGILAGSGTLRSLRTGLRRLLTDPIELSSGVTSLARVGVIADRDGRLSIQESDLRTALQSDPQLVEELIGGEQGVAQRLENFLDSYSRTGGILDQQIESAQSRQALFDSRIASYQETLVRREESLLQYLAELQASIGALVSEQSYLSNFFG